MHAPKTFEADCLRRIAARISGFAVMSLLTIVFAGCTASDTGADSHVAEPSPRSSDEGRRRAVLIGVDDYRSDSVSDLSGAGNDVDLMRAVLVGKFEFQPEDIVVLKDGAATRDGILTTIRDHLGQSQASDVALVHYSGHGSQMVDRSGDEGDRLDETIVPHDSRTDGIFDISDDEINELMREISRKTRNVVFILDSCHSGTAARAADNLGLVRQARFTPADERMPPPPSGDGQRALEGIDDFRLPGAGYVLISGSRANELANEIRFGGTQHGVMTYYLASALQSAGVQATYRDVMDRVASDVTARFDDQHPQLEGTGVDTAVFGVEQLVQQPYLLVNPVEGQPDRAVVGAGRVFGLANGMTLDVYPPGTRRFDGTVPPTGRVRIDRVDAFSAEAEIMDGELAVGSRSVLDLMQSADFHIAVQLDDLPPALATDLEGRLAVYDAIALTETAGEADMRVFVAGEGDDARYVVRGRTVDALAEVPASASAASELEDVLVHWARWHAVLALRNPAPDMNIDLAVTRIDGPSPTPVGETVAHESKIRIRVSNDGEKPVFPVVLNLTDSGRVKPVYPPANVPISLGVGDNLDFDLEARVVDGGTKTVDVIKVIATTVPISPEPFRLEPMSRDVAPPPRDDESPLQRYLRQYATGMTRELFPVSVSGWATRQKVLRVVRTDVRLDGFSAFYADAAAADQTEANLTRSGSRSICGPTGGNNCFEVVDYFDDPEMRMILPPQVRSGQRDPGSVGAAFEQAYQYREETGARRVEPLLEVRLPESVTAPVAGDPTSRGGGGHEDLQKAKDDDLWSLKYTRVPEAWALLRSDGKPEGAEANGVVIAHPDTGYLQHAEIWEPADDRPIWPDKGYNYHEDNDDPRDVREKETWLSNPAHGTGSSSAIVSEAGCQLAGATQCPTGIAQGAHLVPLRINSSVVNFSTKKLARALLDASGDDRSRVKVDTQLAAIAMGGPPSWTLWKATGKAEDRGFIVIAAAGNYVRTVVWPARFDAVLSVAAVNADCVPWVHSSRGRGVDLSATGESVWRGTMGGDDLMTEVTGMGTGTTYATSTTAGIAALWVAHHKGSPEYQALKDDGKLTQTLISLLRQTSWRPNEVGQPSAADCREDAGWNSRRFGAGIVDARALLEAPLDSAVTRGERAVDVDQLPLWYSLYAPGDSIARASEDYRLLFETGQNVTLDAVYPFEAEVLYHYATDESLRTLIDQVVEGNQRDEVFERIRARILLLDSSSSLRAAVS